MSVATRWLAAVLLLGVTAAACAGDETATSVPTTPPSSAPATRPSTAVTAAAATDPPTTLAPTTSTAPRRDYAAPGPNPVGVTTLTLPSGAAVEVWYPAADPVTGTTGYDVRDFVPEAIRALLTADVPATVAYPGQRDVAAASGRRPLVLFSHGFGGIRVQSSLITSHLASHGMIVAAPDHPSRDLARTLTGPPGDRAESVADLLATLDLLTAEDTTAGGRLEGRVHTDRVGLVGHSAGGFTVITAALDDRVDGYVSMASGGPAVDAPYPATPSLFLAGALDGVAAPTATRAAFDAAPSPSWYVELAATGHNGFDDFCTIGNGTGIIGIAEASGLGPLLDGRPELRALGQDGCIPPAAPVVDALPTIRHATTAFLRHTFGDDAEPALGAELVATGPLAVTTASR